MPAVEQMDRRLLILMLFLDAHLRPRAARQLFRLAWYIKDVFANPDPSTMDHIGRTIDGPFDASSCTDSLVVLNFGQPDFANGTYGTNYWVTYYPYWKFISDADILTAVENYAGGWFARSGMCARLHLVVGTNNYNETPSGGTPSAAGGAWAALAHTLQGYLSNKGWSWQITAWAGSDMEQPGGGQNWDCAAKTRQFVDGYNGDSSGTQVFLDYGTAWVPNPYPSGTCWNSADVYHVAYGARLDWPLPEIYTPSATDSWVSVSNQSGQWMRYKGVMAECQQADPLPPNNCTDGSGQFSPGGALWDLWNKWAANQQGSLDYASNIRWKNY